MDLNQEFWEDRYKTKKTGWDLGEISTPLKTYIDQLTNKNLKILIPGGGNSYEAEYLHNKGFENVYVVDLSKTALQNIKTRVPSFPTSHLIQEDFFDIDMAFDLIIEQTFFCAITPDLRPAYAVKASEITNTNGKLVGLLFNTLLNQTHPPFGGYKAEYLEYFKPYFEIKIMEEAHNSIKERQGKELFFIMVTKK
ncbi:methyltransferase domain-containing protein [Oceanihabitans sp. 2_MG-2023]|uniref:methyltransferase domain-containing protein n=1 Tax=Oceanihabitans sp. 2_MG-2023 TaxID=3062661 RepID=UPI0026E18478|nr:methyltransferase domain-containing protein [Oceanihabitans sp. 2_MG-2023]MDO6597413.1 methyltransferase domain-containing protein [Oceanihabitans sp. 2_MG-2023]